MLMRSSLVIYTILGTRLLMYDNGVILLSYIEGLFLYYLDTVVNFSLSKEVARQNEWKETIYDERMVSNQ